MTTQTLIVSLDSLVDNGKYYTLEELAETLRSNPEEVKGALLVLSRRTGWDVTPVAVRPYEQQLSEDQPRASVRGRTHYLVRRPPKKEQCHE